MINIVLYNLSKSFYAYDLGVETIYVAPGPVLADALRSKLNNQNVTVTTMAQFLLGLFKEYLGAEEGRKYQSKSQLLLTLGLAWRQIGAGNFAQFKNAFMLLTDLRSYTQDEVLLTSLLEEFDSTLAEIVLKMNRLMQGLAIVDEHAAYWSLIQEVGRTENLGPKKSYCFWGFDFLSPMQVDFLKNFSNHHDVYMPIPKEVFESSVSSDWIEWIAADAKILDAGDNLEHTKAKILTYPKGYLAQALKTELAGKEENSDIYLATKIVTADEVQSVASSEHFFKVSIQAFGDKLSGVDSYLKHILSGNNVIALEKFRELLAQEQATALNEKDYLKLKIYKVYQDVTERWEELTDQELVFDWFMSELLKEIVNLDLTRLSMLPIQAENKGKIWGLKDLHSIDTTRANYLCISSEMGDIKISESSLYSNTAESRLLQIGPIRRSGLEEHFTISKLKEILACDRSIVLLEEGTRERSQVWHDLLLGLEESPVNLEFKTFESKPLPSVQVGKEFEILDLTASKVQAYLDCPRKFYHNYLDGIFPKIKLVESFLPMQMGDLAHKIIEKLVMGNIQDKIEIDQCIENELHAFYEQNEVQTSLDVHYEYLANLRIKVFKVAGELFQLIQNLQATTKFEKKMEITKNRIKRKGRYDLFLDSDSIQILLDFKSSGYGIPTLKSLESYDVIQMWFYLSLLDYLGELSSEKMTIVGYINLSNPDKSLAIAFGQGDLPEGIKNLEIFNKIEIISTPLFVNLEQYREFEKSLIDSIHADKAFLPRPRKDDACTYCPLNVVCPKGVDLEILA